mmetsp:Transcript_62831/g.70361  ORF Transcript_62831/g.70361 Transcript_62831/m.70361 type:complete len:312 (+) Transcript_62831:130-1065(+)
MVYRSFKYDNRRDHHDEEEEALGVILKGRDDGNDAADDADEEEEANDIMIATADSTRFKAASIPFLLLLVVLSCFLLGVDFGSGTATFSLSTSSPSSSSLPLSLSSSLSSYNNNIDESVISSIQDLDSVATTHTTIDETIGGCRTTGTYSSVNDYKAGGSITFGEPYWGLKMKYSLLSTQTLFPDRCYWHNSKDHNHQCPDSENGQKKIVEAWQQCAEACNKNERCVTYSARVDFVNSRRFHRDAHYLYTCYLHDRYTCIKDGTGISLHDIEAVNTYMNIGYWSGLCRLETLQQSSASRHSCSCKDAYLPC